MACASLAIILLLLRGFVLVTPHMCTCVRVHRPISHGNDGIVCFLACRGKDYTKPSLWQENLTCRCKIDLLGGLAF